MKHDPVLCREVADLLAPANASGDYLDATFGMGGHSRELLARLSVRSRLVAVDRDEEAFTRAEALAAVDGRVLPRRGCFGEIESILSTTGIDRLRGAILDLGISSVQLGQPERGFSFQEDGPLDMRMDRRQRLTVGDWLNEADADELARVLREYGEERYARRISRAILAARPLSTTRELARVVVRARAGRASRIHPATRVFQALRIFINGELDALRKGLEAVFARLAIGGRVAVISFHSLEDRIVKRDFRARTRPPPVPREIPVAQQDLRVTARIVAGPVRAGHPEVTRNPRARSAVLRVLERAA